MWKDVCYLYEKIDKQREHRGIRTKYHTHLILEEWKNIFSQAELQFCQIAQHIEDYKDIYGPKEFGILKKPKIEPCIEENKCKKCIEKANL